MKSFLEYSLSRNLETITIECLKKDNLEIEINESIDDLKRYFQILSQKLNQLQLNTKDIDVYEKTRKLIDNLKSYILKKDQQTIPVNSLDNNEQLLNLVVRSMNKNFKDVNYIKYMMSIFNKQIKSYLKSDEIELTSYINHFKNWLQNPSINNSQLLKKDNDSMVMQAAQKLKNATSDEEISNAIDQSLNEFLSDLHLRQISLHDRRTKQGRQKINYIMQSFGKSYDDFSNQLKTDPVLSQRFNKTLKDRRKQYGPINNPFLRSIEEPQNSPEPVENIKA